MPSTREALFAQQDHFFKVAKKLIKENGQMMGFTFLITNGKNLQRLRKEQVQVVRDENGPRPITEGEFKEMQEGEFDLAHVAMMNELTPKQALDVIMNEMAESDRKELIEVITFGKQYMRMPEDVLIEKTLNGVCKAMGFHPKDVTALAIKQLCKQVDAFAIIKVDDGYTVNKSKTKGMTPEQFQKEFGRKSISDHPASDEAVLCIMETEDEIRMMKCPYEREGGKNSDTPVKDFKEDEVDIIDRKDPNFKGSGRFMGLLKPFRGNTSAPYVPKSTPEA